jgi:PPOX class probable F420-dependent enzyme
MLIDDTTDFGRRVSRRLQEEQVIWLTTIGPDGTPQPRPVWFLWDGETFLIYSQPETHKLAHIGHSPKVALNLNSDDEGGDIIVFTGVAYMDEDQQPANQVADYADKYRAGFQRIGMTAQEFADSFSVPLRIRPASLRGH